MVDKLSEIKKKVTGNNLYISRIPIKSKLRFKELADEEFDGDFGFCLKFLLDFFDGLLSNPNQMMVEQIEMLHQEISTLKSGTPEIKQERNKKKVIRSLSGKIITEREE